MGTQARLAIVGAGNIGRAIALGLAGAGRFEPQEIVLTRRKLESIEDLTLRGFQTQSDNRDAVRRSAIVILAVQPQQLDSVVTEIAAELDPARHLLISVVSGASIADLLRLVGRDIPIARAMPNTAIAVGRSMTCVATHSNRLDLGEQTRSIFDAVGLTILIDEELMIPATALCACGIAFFLRALRAAAQGGIRSVSTPRRR